ncbi:MAG TPA: hypothetical protein DF613_05275 [Lachnospiraceae bacterium]|nr:hypothetical protein [Lachnospiraceae bacterium]
MKSEIHEAPVRARMYKKHPGANTVHRNPPAHFTQILHTPYLNYRYTCYSKKIRERKWEIRDACFLEQPVLAMEHCSQVMHEMSELTANQLDIAVRLLDEYNEENAHLVRETERLVDTYEDKKISMDWGDRTARRRWT